MYSFEDTINNITRKTGEEIERKIPKLELSGIGGSMKDNIINHEKLVFKHKGKLNELESIKLIKEVVSVYLKNMYSERKMEFYLKKSPFSYKKLQITIVVYNEKGDDVYHPELGYINLVNGLLIYETLRITEKGFYKVETLKEESYEDAVKRLGVSEDQ